ncbi:alpha/beta fold hydrolase [Rhizobium puerariae]|uniref:Alpha/beta fold hydrolase n=1 Tax=Rhizobium puerariae TaxID=1585791 RepID=A0ABV6AD37_9HYPH
MSFTESLETITGCNVRFMRGGKGAPLLFLHGSGGAGRWLPFMEKLSESHEVIVPEHPGFGASDSPEWLDGMSDLAFFYLDVLDHLGLDRVNLVGGSIGGWLAAEIAIRDCARLASLTMAGPAGLRVKGLRKGDVFMWNAEETARNLFHDQAYAEQMLAARPSAEELETVLRNRLTTAKLAWEPRFHNPDLHKWLHRIIVPTLILWGDRDKVVPAGYGVAYEDLIPDARLEIIRDCGHLPQIEKVDRFVELVGGFIREVTR